eukprot:8036031-Pyramimonas_sp.AAC.1
MCIRDRSCPARGHPQTNHPRAGYVSSRHHLSILFLLAKSRSHENMFISAPVPFKRDAVRCVGLHTSDMSQTRGFHSPRFVRGSPRLTIPS